MRREFRLWEQRCKNQEIQGVMQDVFSEPKPVHSWFGHGLFAESGRGRVRKCVWSQRPLMCSVSNGACFLSM